MGFYLNKQFMITSPSFPFSLPQLVGYLLNKGYVVILGMFYIKSVMVGIVGP